MIHHQIHLVVYGLQDQFKDLNRFPIMHLRFTD